MGLNEPDTQGRIFKIRRTVYCLHILKRQKKTENRNMSAKLMGCWYTTIFYLCISTYSLCTIPFSIQSSRILESTEENLRVTLVKRLIYNHVTFVILIKKSVYATCLCCLVCTFLYHNFPIFHCKFHRY